MGLCGFNQDMLDGLSLFAKGLLKQVPKRAKEDGLTFENSIKQELSEMETFLEVLRESNNETTFMEGVAYIAKALYDQSLDANDGNSDAKIIDRYKRVAEVEVEFCRKLDEEYYNNLRPNAADPHEAFKALKPWIETYKK